MNTMITAFISIYVIVATTTPFLFYGLDGNQTFAAGG